MVIIPRPLKSFVAAFLIAAAPVWAAEHDDELDALFAGLKTAEDPGAVEQIERRIYDTWVEFASETNLPVEFEMGVSRGLSFTELIHGAHAIVTSAA